VTIFPVGYTNTLVDLATLKARHASKMHPEYARRLFAAIEAADGLVGIGSGWRSTTLQRTLYASDPNRYAPPGSSFHEFQDFASGIRGYAAVDTVGVDGRHGEAWKWLADNGATFGLLTFADVNGEPWHVQCLDLPVSVAKWKRAGSPDPAVFELPGDAVDPEPSPAPEPAPVEPVPEPTPVPVPPAPSTPEVCTVNVTVPRLDPSSPRTGDIAVHVKSVQAILNAKSGAGLTVDGVYGARTEDAVKAWQAWHKLTVDGWVGPQTWTSLIEGPRVS
jgi:hypothetical protein